MSGTADLWRPLRTPIFRQLLIADVVSDVGTFMQGVGAAWLMVSIGASPLFVALTQTAATLPFFLFALPAGAVGDIVDRRLLILYTEAWMLAVAIALAAAAIGGVMTPSLLLALTFALSVGDAVESPTWRAVLPELVPKEDLPAASALNGIEFNIARAVGPALAGALIAAAGVGAAFLVNVVSFLGVIIVVARWKRPSRARTAPAETLPGATVAAIRYVRNVPATRGVMLRSGVVMFFASAPFALLPAIAHRVSGSAIGYGALLGCFGAGAVGGALVMQWARARASNEAIVSTAIVILGCTIVALAGVHNLPGLMAVMLVSGGAWIGFISLANALVQTMAPDWVRARVLAIFMLITQGGLAAGSATWGLLASRASIDTALVWAGLGTIATTALGLWMRLPDGAADVSPWNHWRMPAIVQEGGPWLEQGPVLVTAEYRVDPEQADAFLRAMRNYERVRRRDGASRWDLYRDLEQPNVYLETFIVVSWAEHLRQHERLTRGDSALEQLITAHSHGEPQVRHFIHAESSPV
jgi:MFS family permease/quinol monooxygenase YgiN